jgi:hypothetical protein
MTRGGLILVLPGLVLGAAAGALHAQQLPPAAVDSKACTTQDRLRPGEQNPTAPPQTTGEGLSDRLARTDGVICPPNVDPAINAPTPEAGKMRVIPPPGSPGGDPTVRPK